MVVVGLNFGSYIVGELTREGGNPHVRLTKPFHVERVNPAVPRFGGQFRASVRARRSPEPMAKHAPSAVSKPSRAVSQG